MQRFHPLDSLICDNSLCLLEALVPIVEYRYKLPLVLFIKYRELTEISKSLEDPFFLERCGFMCNSKDPDCIWDTLKKALPPEIGNQIKQMKTMMQAMSYMDLFSEADNKEKKCPDSGTDSESLYDSIINILNEGECND